MSDHSESDCCGSDVDETERLLLEDTLSPTEKEKSQPPADIDEIAPPAKTIDASTMPSPSTDTLATILDTVQKLAKRMDRLENRENMRRGAMEEGGGRGVHLTLLVHLTSAVHIYPSINTYPCIHFNPSAKTRTLTCQLIYWSTYPQTYPKINQPVYLNGFSSS